MRLDSYHPSVIFIFFIIVLSCSCIFNHPVYVLITFICAFLYSLKLLGRKKLVFNLLLLPFTAIWTFIYSFYNHFGVTNLFTNFIGNNITLESVVYGLVTGITVSSIILWLECMHEIITTDHITYLIGRVVPRGAMMFSLILRFVPRVGRAFRIMTSSRYMIGKGRKQGSLYRRIKHRINIVSMLISFITENCVEIRNSMLGRGVSLRGRTAYSIYRFDYRDRNLIIIMFWCSAVIMMASMLDQTRILYNPSLIFNKITPVSIMFYAVYAFVCLLPAAIQCKYEYSFKRKITAM